MTQSKGFKEPNMPPPKPIGPWSPEDQERIRLYQKKLYGGTPLKDSRPPKPPRKKPEEERSGGYAGKGDGRRQRKYDVAKIVALYLAGSTPTQISEETGANNGTVVNYLKAEKVWDPNRSRGINGGTGRTPKERCIRNHDLTNPANVMVRTYPDGSPRGRECRLCIKERKES